MESWLEQLLSASLFSSSAIYLGTAAVMLLAAAVYVLIGFGAGLIAVGALAMLLPDLRDVVVLLLLVNALPEIAVVAANRRAVSWRGVLLICVGIALGVPLGTAALKLADPSYALAGLGALLVLVGLAFLLLRPTRLRWPRWAGALAGLLGGVLAGLFGTGGPPLILYYRLAGVDKAAFRSNLMAIFLLITVVRLVSYGVSGLIGLERLISAALLLPAVLLGAALGNAVHLQIRELTFQRLVAVALLLMGLLLLLR